MSGQPNERLRDLWDLWVLRELVTPSPQLREVCEETFRIREKHSWPPTILVHAYWVEPFAALAQGERLPVPDAPQAAEDVREYVRRITGS